jgi:hypothetical protein
MRYILLASVVLASCASAHPAVLSSGAAKYVKQCSDQTNVVLMHAKCPVPTPTPTPVPAPTPAPTGWLPSPSLTGLAPIDDTLSTSALLPEPIPASGAPDIMGAFRFICNAGQVLKDDPIVYPGQSGKSHLHQFYGNVLANANSTYESLRTTGDTTCMTVAFNRSAYWMPAMLDGLGDVVKPDFVSIYYKRRPRTDPKCQGFPGEGKCVALPNGLRFIFGFDMLTGKAPTGANYFACYSNPSIHFASLAAATCAPGDRIGASIRAPNCWDGKNLDSPNHRDHVAYMTLDPNSGQPRCDAEHPYVIPEFLLGAWFTITSPLSTWSFSSDAMHPELSPGGTFHADFFMAWKPAVHAMWEENCLDKLLNCSAGNLGNGFRMPGAEIRSDPNPKVVPLSSLGAQ